MKFKEMLVIELNKLKEYRLRLININASGLRGEFNRKQYYYYFDQINMIDRALDIRFKRGER